MTADPLDTLPNVAATNDNGALRVVMERLGGLAAALLEVKALVQSMDAQQRRDAIERATSTTAMDAKIVAAHTRLDDHDDKLDELENAQKETDREYKAAQKEADKKLGRFEAAYNVMVFVGGALGLSVIALIWSLITGQVHLVVGP